MGHDSQLEGSMGTKGWAKIMHTMIVLVSVLEIADGFIAETNKGIKRCYSTDISSDKTLEVRFGFPRRQRQNCKIKLDIHLKNLIVSGSRDQKKQKLLVEREFSCYQMPPREFYVHKHTPTQDQLAGAYEICIQNIADYGNNNTYVELIISEKYDPVLYQEAFENIPLVESQELIEIEGIIMNIKRSLSYCQQHTRQAEDLSQKLNKQMEAADSLSTTLTYIQILVLIVYTGVWLALVSILHRKWKK